MEYPLLLEGSLALFDADVGPAEVEKIRNKDLYLILPDPDSLALERRIIAYIISLDNEDIFFIKFDQERDAFLLEFKAANIKSLALVDVVDPKKTSIDRCKAWAETNKAKFKQYVTYYCERSGLGDDFRSKFVERVNQVNQQHGLPTIT